jgi:hypothetical protein
MDRKRHPERSLSVDVTAPGGAATTSDDTSCRTEYDDVLNLSSDTSSPTGDAASLVVTVGDGSESGVFVKRDKMYQNLRNQAVKAIDQLPQDEKAFYIEALEKAPVQVWKEECNLDAFLRVEDFHARNAAMRLCSCWRLRSQSFGPKGFIKGFDSSTKREKMLWEFESSMFCKRSP